MILNDVYQCNIKILFTLKFVIKYSEGFHRRIAAVQTHLKLEVFFPLKPLENAPCFVPV